MKNRKHLRLAAMLMLALALSAGLAGAVDAVIVGQATYASSDTMDNWAEIGYEGDPQTLLFVSGLEVLDRAWVILPEGQVADDYLGKGVRYTVAEVVRPETDEHVKMVRADTLEAFAESAEGTLLELTDDEVVVEVTFGSAEREFETVTMRFAITEDTVWLTPVEEGAPIDVLYDGQNNALYLIRRNG